MTSKNCVAVRFLLPTPVSCTAHFISRIAFACAEDTGKPTANHHHHYPFLFPAKHTARAPDAHAVYPIAANEPRGTGAIGATATSWPLNCRGTRPGQCFPFVYIGRRT